MRLGVIQVEQDLWTILDESWDLIYCRYIVIIINTKHNHVEWCRSGGSTVYSNWRGSLTAACRSFADAGRVHLCCGPRWEDHVHFRDSVGPFGTVSGPSVVSDLCFYFFFDSCPLNVILMQTETPCCASAKK